MQRFQRVIISLIVVGALAGGLSGGLLAATGGGDDQPISGDAYQKAVDAALAHTGGGSVTETEIGDGGAAYEVEIRLDDGREVEVELDADFNVIGSAADDDGPNDSENGEGAGDDD